MNVKTKRKCKKVGIITLRAMRGCYTLIYRALISMTCEFCKDEIKEGELLTADSLDGLNMSPKCSNCYPIPSEIRSCPP